MTAKLWQKKIRAWGEILSKFYSLNRNGIKRDLSQLKGSCTYDPDLGTIDGYDHTWTMRNIIKRFLGISQVLSE